MSLRNAVRGSLAMAALACLAMACGDDGGDTKNVPNTTKGDDKYSLTRDGAEVAISPIYRECREDADCTLVSVGCDGCCQQDSIAGDLKAKFDEAFAAACKGYSDGICDCSYTPLVARCQAGACMAAPPDETDANMPQPDGGKVVDRAQQCADVNLAIRTEVAKLQACTSASECGKQLPTLGSCGCTHNAVGRLDANTAELVSLHAQRGELEDIPGCEGLAGTCDCPAVGGVDCIDKQCAWVSLEGDDPCALLEQSTYASVKDLECGLGPNGVELCRWSLSFTSSEFTWQHSDVGETGSFACKDGAITASPSGGASYTGTITADGKLTFEGEAYERK